MGVTDFPALILLYTLFFLHSRNFCWILSSFYDHEISSEKNANVKWMGITTIMSHQFPVCIDYFVIKWDVGSTTSVYLLLQIKQSLFFLWKLIYIQFDPLFSNHAVSLGMYFWTLPNVSSLCNRLRRFWRICYLRKSGATSFFVYAKFTFET